MSLELRKSSKWWYGVFMENGQKTIVNLKVRIAGKRPPKRTMQGDDEFEQSRGMAQAAYDLLSRKMRDDRTGEKTLQKLAEMKAEAEYEVAKEKCEDLQGAAQADCKKQAKDTEKAARDAAKKSTKG